MSKSDRTDKEPSVRIKRLPPGSDPAEMAALIASEPEHFGQFGAMDVEVFGDLDAMKKEIGTGQMWEIKSGTKLIGFISLKPLQVPRAAEMGYGVSAAYGKRGNASEAIKQLVQKMSGDYEIFYARTDPKNAASQGALLKAGFERRGGSDTEWVYRYLVKE